MTGLGPGNSLLHGILVYLSLEDIEQRPEQVSYKIPMCKNGDVPYLVLGDIWNCDLGCPTTHICETIDFYNACCPPNRTNANIPSIGNIRSTVNIPVPTSRSNSFTKISPSPAGITPEAILSTLSTQGFSLILTSPTPTNKPLVTKINKIEKLPVYGPATNQQVQASQTKQPEGELSVPAIEMLVWDNMSD